MALADLAFAAELTDITVIPPDWSLYLFLTFCCCIGDGSLIVISRKGSAVTFFSLHKSLDVSPSLNMFHQSLFFHKWPYCAVVQISRQVVLIKWAKCLMAAFVLFFANTLGLTFRLKPTQLTNTRAFKFRYRSMVVHSICNPFCAVVSVPTKCQSKIYDHHLT